MPIIHSKRFIKWIQHGGGIDLETLGKQVIRTTITFPHRQSDKGGWDLFPVTTSLLSDIGVTSHNKVYAVDWKDPASDRLTLSNGMIVADHEHTYDPKHNASKSITYDITIYGDDLIPFQTHTKTVGVEPNGFKIESTMISNELPRRHPEAIDYRDTGVYLTPGALINRVFWGKSIVYQREIQGIVTNFDISLNGAQEVRLVNPLVKLNNSWENARLDIEVDWGDGEITQYWNRKLNTGLFNKESKYIIKHTYKGDSGAKYRIKVKCIEPLVPIGCDVQSISGSFPEDCYCGNPLGLFSYSEKDIEAFPFRSEIAKIKDTCSSLSPDLLDNWVNTTTMSNMFKNWKVLPSIPDKFFKANILDKSISYAECFANCPKLAIVPPDIIGSTNNVVESIARMFYQDTALTGSTIQLSNSSSLQDASYAYYGTNIVNTESFLIDVPSLNNIDSIFMSTQLATYDQNFLKVSTKMANARRAFRDTFITDIHINTSQWKHIRTMEETFASTNITAIPENMFVAPFGTESSDRSIAMNYVFRSNPKELVGDNRLVVPKDLFKPFGNINNKLYPSQVGWFGSCHLQSIPEGLFYDVFTNESPYLSLDSTFMQATLPNEMGYDGGNWGKIPPLFKNATGISNLRSTFSSMTIGYIDPELLKEVPNLKSVERLFSDSRLHLRFPDNFFRNNKKITDFSELFYRSVFTYTNTPIDYVIWSEVDTVNVYNMFGAGNQLMCFKLLGHTSTVNNVIFTRNGKESFGLNYQRIRRPMSYILDSRIDGVVPKFTFDESKNITTGGYVTTVFYSPYEDGEVEFIGENVEGKPVKVSIVNSSSGDYTFPFKIKIPAKKSVEVIIEFFSDKGYTLKDVGDKGVRTIFIDGVFPQNSHPADYTLTPPREYGRFCFSNSKVPAVKGKSVKEDTIGIIHKDAFKYWCDVTSLKDNFPLYKTGDRVRKSLAYGIQPRMFQHMVRLADGDGILNLGHKVISRKLLPDMLQGKSLNVAMPDASNDIDRTFTTTFVQPNAFSRETYTVNVNTRDLTTYGPGEAYYEFRLSPTEATDFKLVALDGITPEFPINMDVIDDKHDTVRHFTLDNLDQVVDIPSGDNVYIRVYSKKLVWINRRNLIKELYGSLPEMDFTFRMKDLAPNLVTVGEFLLVFCTNTSFARTFKGLPNFEYFPGTLFWYNDAAINFEECFADCPKLFKVDDYVITDKEANILNCKGMFKNSGIKNVRHPIMDDVNCKVDVTDMFLGCVTNNYFDAPDIERIVFKNIDVIGVSGIKHDGVSEYMHSEFYVCADPTSERGMALSYFIPRDMFTRNEASVQNVDIMFKYGSQGLEEQDLDLRKNTTLSGKTMDTVGKYLPFVTSTKWTMVPENPSSKEPVKIAVPPCLFKYALRMKRVLADNKIVGDVPVILPKLMYVRNEDIIDGIYYKGVKFAPTVRGNDIYPLNMLCVRDLTESLSGASINLGDGYKLPPNTITNFTRFASNSSLARTDGFFDNVSLDKLRNGTVVFTSAFENNTAAVPEKGVFRTYGSKLNPIQRAVYKNSAVTDFDNPETTFQGCEQLAGLPEIFMNCPNITTLPKINNLTNMLDYSHMFDTTSISVVPPDYIYYKHPADTAVSIEYMFNECVNILVTNRFVDGRSTGKLHVDYSLNNVYSLIGDDSKIFGHVDYETMEDHRSRVIVIDDKVAWQQGIEIYEDNTTVNIVGLRNPTLEGIENSGHVMVVIWGDEHLPKDLNTPRPATTKLVHNNLDSNVLDHTYKRAGKYVVTIVTEVDLCYVDTKHELVSKCRTYDLPTSFKYTVNAAELETKTLLGMFGRGVEHIAANLFENIETSGVTKFDNMFERFEFLSDLEVGILDTFTDLEALPGFLKNSQRSDTNLVLKKGLFDKLTKLRDINHFADTSNVTSVEPHIFDNCTELANGEAMFATCKITELPRDLFHKLPKLHKISYLLYSNPQFILNDSYADFFKYNTKVEYAANTFTKVTIKSIPSTLLRHMVLLKDIAGIFGSDKVDSETNPLPWIEDHPSIYRDPNDWSVPEGLFDGLTQLTTAQYAFCGRMSLKSYPSNLLHTNRKLTSVSGMFHRTSITHIHPNTLKDLSEPNLNMQYMFYGCKVRHCEPFITGSGASVYQTDSSLYMVSGYPTEREIFANVKTSPDTIHSLYRQEPRDFELDIELASEKTLFIKAIQPETFPWNGFLLEVDYGDGNIITLHKDIPDQATLTKLTSRVLPPGKRTVRIQSPYFCQLGETDDNIKYESLRGRIPVMKGDTHYPLANTGYANSPKLTLDDPNLYKNNTHLTSLENAFKDTKIAYIKSGVFDPLTNLTTINHAFENATVFNTKDGYKPLFSTSKGLKTASNAFRGTTGLTTEVRGWMPLKDNSELQDTSYAFYGSGIKGSQPVNVTSLKNASHMYENCKNLTKADTEEFMNSNNCSNYSYLYYNSGLNSLDGTGDIGSFLSGNHNVSTVDYSYAFGKTHLDQGVASSIASTLSGFTSQNVTSVNCTGMFADITSDNIKTDWTNIIMKSPANINMTDMFANSHFIEVRLGSLNIQEGVKSVNIANMFNTCVANNDVNYSKDVFDSRLDITDEQADATNLITVNTTDLHVSFDDGVAPTSVEVVRLADHKPNADEFASEGHKDGNSSSLDKYGDEILDKHDSKDAFFVQTSNKGIKD